MPKFTYREKPELGLKRNGRPRKVPQRPQEGFGNPAWIAAVAKVRYTPRGYYARSYPRKKNSTLEDKRNPKALRYAKWSLNPNQRKDKHTHYELSSGNSAGKDMLGAFLHRE